MDRWLVDYVVQGIQNVFKIGFDYRRTQTKRVSSNMRSVLEHPEVVRDYLAKECAEGRIFGPFDINQLPQVSVNRFGVISKGSRFLEILGRLKGLLPSQKLLVLVIC